MLKYDSVTVCNDALNKLLDVRRAILWKIAEKHGLTPLQIQILQFIKACDGHRKISANDIARELYVSRATMSIALKALVKKSLVKKTMAANDKRRYSLALDAKAYGILKELNRYDKTMRSHLECMPEQSLHAAVTVLISLLELMHDKGFVDRVTMCLKCIHCTEISRNSYRCALTGRTFSFNRIKVGCCNFGELKEAQYA
jgi:DNA-binding MarR family transcriptional regulator